MSEKKQAPKERRGRLPRITRDTALFLAGLGGFIHEVVVTNGERPTLLFGCLALMGLPAFLRADEKKSSGGE